MSPARTTAPSHCPPDVPYAPGIETARFLGWFSIGLGLVELVAPEVLGDAIGVRRRGLLQMHGLREIACGVGLLSSRRPTTWLWARVAGDAVDLATLAAADDVEGARIAAVAVAGVTLLDVATASRMSAAAALEGK
ncbi:MAG TPA: hypothetical protein VFG20_05630 [Planctomycetaceae bacterium]|nr:hypothetical protein [Planctomycetaceae bacterium]